ncbi:MAG TPA: cytochrome c oxidase subunit 3 [Niabella sp.]|nr:cytochrome c oxidase subunit 3 [Chitinophagaceae bacterium]HRN46713.1 cytochrome c oxidase subunit 3 [Niabella sp.]HRO83681.1 cytochrome c oxidase subunit 3 [Niabella sp.]HUN02778.1 cytochrome c oxidase subunit 3 [Niabella sp.]
MDQSTALSSKGINWWGGGKSPFNLEYGKLMMWFFLVSDAFTFGGFLISYGTVRFSQNYWPDPSVVFNAFPFAGHANLPLAFVSVMTFVLILSSVTMVLAVHAGHNRNQKEVEKWLIWTIIGGLFFLGCQAWEWNHLYFGEHPTVVSGHIELIGQATNINPWGELVQGKALTDALNNTSINTLASVVSENHLSDMSHAQLLASQKSELVNMIANSNIHIRETGPVAFGGFFFGITGFHGFHVFSGIIINIIMLLMTRANVFERRGHYLMIEKAGLYWHFVDLVWVFVFMAFYLV